MEFIKATRLQIWQDANIMGTQKKKKILNSLNRIQIKESFFLLKKIAISRCQKDVSISWSGIYVQRKRITHGLLKRLLFLQTTKNCLQKADLTHIALHYLSRLTVFADLKSSLKLLEYRCELLMWLSILFFDMQHFRIIKKKSLFNLR